MLTISLALFLLCYKFLADFRTDELHVSESLCGNAMKKVVILFTNLSVFFNLVYRILNCYVKYMILHTQHNISYYRVLHNIIQHDYII